MGFRQVDGLTKTVVWNLKKSNGTHGIQNLKFGSVVTDIVYDAATDTINVNSNETYTLVVNGKKKQIRSGSNSLK